MPVYNEDDHRRAAQAYIHGGQVMSFKKLETVEGMPSRQILSNWAKKGLGNEGEPWDETKDRLERQQRSIVVAEHIAKRTKDISDLIGDAKKDIVEAISRLMIDLKEGKVKNTTYTQLPIMYEKLIDMENREIAKDVSVMMEDFVITIGKIVVKFVPDEGQRNLLAIELQEILNTYNDNLQKLIGK